MKHAIWRLLGNRISGLLMVVILNFGMLAYTAQAAENAANYGARRGSVAQSNAVGCNKETQRYPSQASPQDARESDRCQVSGGLTPLIHILYGEAYERASDLEMNRPASSSILH